MGALVADAIAILRANSPVGESGAGDEHPGLYRDSHLIFIDGRVVPDVSSWQPGQQINIANPEPYSRKIELGAMKLSLPAHVYENAAQTLAGRYGNSVAIKFTFMPVRFGDNAAFAAFSTRQRQGRRLSAKARRDWLVRQPALQINAR